jgi:hypothetical protein
MTDSESNAPTSNEQLAQSPAPTPPPIEVPTLQEIRGTHEMLMGFRDGVREGTFQGKHLVHIAMGLQFLDNMVDQSSSQLDYAKKLQKEAMKAAKEELTKLSVIDHETPPEPIPCAKEIN